MQLLEAVSEIISHKGKVLQDETGKVYVFDCHHWSDECSYQLRFLCPDALVGVESAVSSLSGFVIVLQQHEPHHKAYVSWRRMCMAVTVTTLIYLLILGLHYYYQTDITYAFLMDILQNQSSFL